MPVSVNTIVWDDLYEAFSDQDSARRFAGIFLKECRARMQHLREGVEEQDAERLAGIAHALKSPSRWVGATPLADACVRLETAARSAAPFDQLGSIVHDIHGLMADVEAALVAELGPASSFVCGPTAEGGSTIPGRPLP